MLGQLAILAIYLIVAFFVLAVLLELAQAAHTGLFGELIAYGTVIGILFWRFTRILFK